MSSQLGSLGGAVNKSASRVNNLQKAREVIDEKSDDDDDDDY